LSIYCKLNRCKQAIRAGLAHSLFICCVAAPTITAADAVIIRLGTGGSAGTYFPIGSLIAKAISGPVGIHKDQTFYERELIAVAQRGTGSDSNVQDVSQGLLEAGLAQADIVHWAYTGSGPFENEPARDNLRGLASLYVESVHLIARSDAGITTINDLENKRVSLAEVGSGTFYYSWLPC